MVEGGMGGGDHGDGGKGGGGAEGINGELMRFGEEWRWRWS